MSVTKLPLTSAGAGLYPRSIICFTDAQIVVERLLKSLVEQGLESQRHDTPILITDTYINGKSRPLCVPGNKHEWNF